MTHREMIENIHESFINGQNKQAVEQIQEYGVYDFVADYEAYLDDVYVENASQNSYLANAFGIFLRLTNR